MAQAIEKGTLPFEKGHLFRISLFTWFDNDHNNQSSNSVDCKYSQLHRLCGRNWQIDPVRHFWLSTRFSYCLKMKPVQNVLGYIQDQFYRFSRGLWNCSRKYTKMFKTDSFLGNKIGFKPDCFGVIMPVCDRMFCCIFGWHF